MEPVAPLDILPRLSTSSLAAQALRTVVSVQHDQSLHWQHNADAPPKQAVENASCMHDEQSSACASSLV